MGGSNGALGDQSGSIALLQAVPYAGQLYSWNRRNEEDSRNDNLLDVSDLVGTVSDTPAALVRRTPETEIIDRVDVDILAEGCLVVASPTVVVADLTWLFRLLGEVGGDVRCGVLGSSEWQDEGSE